MSQRDRDVVLKFQRVVRKSGAAFLTAKKHLLKTWQAKKAHAMEKLSRHSRDDAQASG
ncbi:MAG TPA: hypothetical protein VMJ11_27025 [Paraburkholderia sp.]|uniref:hypothetical protein n=1 Tax=Paraburkholderia sp. TaxID=1926495 RepID=UPI002C85B217|nr:hypothetical protein [Paraburkholderia sp.]HTR10242.1 hypothetical protein [Paraburkholderia sp.]